VPLSACTTLDSLPPRQRPGGGLAALRGRCARRLMWQAGGVAAPAASVMSGGDLGPLINRGPQPLGASLPHVDPARLAATLSDGCDPGQRAPRVIVSPPDGLTCLREQRGRTILPTPGEERRIAASRGLACCPGLGLRSGQLLVKGV